MPRRRRRINSTYIVIIIGILLLLGGYNIYSSNLLDLNNKGDLTVGRSQDVGYTWVRVSPNEALNSTDCLNGLRASFLASGDWDKECRAWLVDKTTNTRIAEASHYQAYDGASRHYTVKDMTVLASGTHEYCFELVHVDDGFSGFTYGFTVANGNVNPNLEPQITGPLDASCLTNESIELVWQFEYNGAYSWFIVENGTQLAEGSGDGILGVQKASAIFSPEAQIVYTIMFHFIYSGLEQVDSVKIIGVWGDDTNTGTTETTTTTQTTNTNTNTNKPDDDFNLVKYIEDNLLAVGIVAGGTVLLLVSLGSRIGGRGRRR